LKVKTLVAATSALASLFWLAPVFAQETSNEKVSYERGELAAFNATTAEDLIRHVPGGGQILDAGSGGGGGGGQNQRGFGASGAQILIDGRRTTGKSNDIGAVLRRIDAKQVERIELIRDTTDGLDVTSKGVVINLVLAKGAAQTGQGVIELNARFNDAGRREIDGLASYAGTTGNVEYFGSFERSVRAPISFGQARYSDRFRDERYYYPNGSLQEMRPQTWGRSQSKYITTANLTWTPDALSQFRLNGYYETFSVHERATTPLTRFSTAGVVTLNALETQVRDTTHRTQIEIGGDYERKIGNGDFKALFIIARRDQPTVDARERLAGTVLTQLSASDIRQKSNEDILRVSYSFPAFGQRLELGGEGARNRLGQLTQLFGDTNGDGRVDPIMLPEAQARVQEMRGETYAKLNGKLGGGFSHETSLTAEYSRITSSYALYKPRSYLFLKPRLDLRYDASDRTQFGLRIEQEVGQLDFGNFVPSYDGLSDRLLAGNPGIAPETTWIGEVRAEHRFAKGRGSIELRLFYEKVSGEIDKMVIGTDATGKAISASGNIGTATLYGGEGKFNVKLDPLGLKGAIFSGRAKRTISTVLDPFTKLDRPARGKIPLDLSLNFRQDFSKLGLSYGIDFFHLGGSQVLSDIFAREQLSAGPRFDGFIQKKLGRFTVRLDAQQFTGANERRTRTIFTDSQTIGTVLRREAFDESRDRRFTLKVRTGF
jgi:outer membrane receptor for ferrienterochelin and colicins